MENDSIEKISKDILRNLPDPFLIRHKGIAGRILVIGGCEFYAGAPRLAAMGALRSGAGLVTIAAPETLIPRILGAAPDIMALPLPGNSWSIDHVPSLLKFASRCDCVVLGPGMGRGEGQTAFTATFLSHDERPPCVIDADALIAARKANALSWLSKNDVLTPHPGEAATILETTIVEVQRMRMVALTSLASLAPCVWLLKGINTLIGQALNPSYMLECCEPNLAVGGSGDVLSGCIATCLAQTKNPIIAAQCGALIHGSAGHILRSDFPMRGNTASDIADAIPKARAYLMED